MSLKEFLKEAENNVSDERGFLNFYWSRKLIRIVREMKRHIDVCKLTDCLKRCDEIAGE